MIFADLDLARRLERMEAIGGASFVDARRRLSPELGATWIDVKGTFAMYDGPDSPVTQTFGLGLFAEPTIDDLERLEVFFQARGAHVAHEVSPLSGLPVAQMLSRRGYRPIEFTSVMFKPLLLPNDGHAPDSSEPADRRLRARPIVAGEEERWSEVAARGWAELPELREFLIGMGRVVASTEGSRAFFAHIEGEPVATGMLRCHEGVALFGGASTVPEARKKGAHRVLFEARTQAALAANCDLGMICAQPGSTSQRNAERLGFRIAYTRIKWQLANQ